MALRSVCCRRSVARTAGQERQPFLEPRQQRRRREDPYPCRRQLDRQRQPVQPPADLRHRRGVLRRKVNPARTACARSTKSRTAS